MASTSSNPEIELIPISEDPSGVLANPPVATAADSSFDGGWTILAEMPVLDAGASGLISADQAVRLRAVPFRVEQGRLKVVMDDPADFAAADELSVLTGMPIDRLGAAPGLFESLLRTAFGATAAQMGARLAGGGTGEDDLASNLQAVDADDVQRMAEQPTLINL